MNWQKTNDKRIKKRGDFYWARFTARGVRVEESLQTRSFTLAKAICDDIEGNIHLGVNWKKERELFETAWFDFLSDKAKGVKTKPAREKTLREYVGFGERYFMPYFKEHRLSDINEEGWQEFVEHIRREKPKILFFNMRKYLMGFLSWAKRKGKIREMPELYNPDKKHDDTEAIGKVYSVDEIAGLMVYSFGRVKLWIGMAAFMGMRSSEITQLKMSRIDWAAGVIRLKSTDTKTAQPRVVPIHEIVMPLLKECSGHFGAFLFPNRIDPKRAMDPTGFKKPWLAVKKAAGVKGRFHDLRHTWITNAIKSGMNPAAIAKIAGMSINVLDKVYLHLSESDLSAELEKFSMDTSWTNPILGGGAKSLSH